MSFISKFSVYISIPNEISTSICENGFPRGPVSKCIYEGQEVGWAGGFLGTGWEARECLLPKIKKVYLFIFVLLSRVPFKVYRQKSFLSVFLPFLTVSLRLDWCVSPLQPLDWSVCHLAYVPASIWIGLTVSLALYCSASFSFDLSVCLVNLWDVLSVSMYLD